MKKKYRYLFYILLLCSCNRTPVNSFIEIERDNPISGMLLIVENPYDNKDSVLAVLPESLGGHLCKYRNDCEDNYFPTLNSQLISVLDTIGKIKDSLHVDLLTAFNEDPEYYNYQVIVYTSYTEELCRQRYDRQTGKELWIFVGEKVSVRSATSRGITYQNVSDSLKIPTIEVYDFVYDNPSQPCGI